MLEKIDNMQKIVVLFRYGVEIIKFGRDMMVKLKLLFFIIVLGFSITGCGTKGMPAGTNVDNRPVSNPPTQIYEEKNAVAAENAANSLNPDSSSGSEKNDQGKLQLAHNEKLKYTGYMDAVSDWFGTKYELSDYDNDGIKDRVYREASFSDPSKEAEGLIPDRVSIRIDFGNGSKLELGTFEDAFLGIKIIGADLTGDGNNEIIFLGHHDALTEPESYSEIAVFRKNGTIYEMVPLPAPVEETTGDKYLVGYPVYVKNDTGSEITLFADYANYKETIQIDRTDYNRDEKYQDGAIISSYAWGTGTERYDNKTALVLYQRIGERNYNKNNLKIVLEWQGSEFKPVKTDIVDKHYEW